MDFNHLEHPEDRAIREKLDAILKFKDFMTNTICALREKYIAVAFVGNGVHITDSCFPDLHRQNSM